MSVKDFKELPGFKDEHVAQLASIGINTVDELRAAISDKAKQNEVLKTLTGEVGPNTLKKWAAVIDGTEKATEVSAEVVEAGVYTASIKPELDESTVDALALRAIASGNRPAFKRQEWYRYKMLGDKWRRPRGIHSKMRRGFKRRPPMVEVGYRGPATVRGLHPSGFEEVLVYNAEALGSIDAKKQAVRIGGTVGVKKRLAIEARAAELGVRVLNPVQRKV